MKILFGASPSKFFHMKEFVDELEKIDVECKLVLDADVSDRFPSRKISNWFSSKKKFNEIIQQFKPDAIFVDRQRHFALDASETNIPLLVHVRGDFWKEIEMARKTLYKLPHKRIVLQQWERMGEKCFKKSSLFLPICKYLEDIVRKNYPEKETSVLQSGVTISRWYQKEGMKLKHPCVGLVQGAVIWGKTQEMLVLKKVLESMPDVTFYWAGDGPFRSRILSELEKYDNFVWLGALEYPDKIREYLTEIDIYALVSGIDMSPLTLQEAQLMKNPVVATNVGGIPELMKENETGFLVEKGNAEEWIEKLRLLVDNKEKREEMGHAGRKFVEENFSWEKIGREFLKVLKNKGID